MPSPTPQIRAEIYPTYFPPARYFTDIGSIVNLLIPIIMTIGAVTFGAMLMYAGFLVVTSQGEEQKIEEAKKVATYAFIGLVVMFMAYTIVLLLTYILNVELPF